MSTTVTCVYTINAAGQLSPTNLAAAMAAANIPVPPEFLALTGATVTSDNSVAGFTNAVRTIVFNITSAQFQAQFPHDAASPFLGLLTLPIGLFVNAPVVESFPLVA